MVETKVVPIEGPKTLNIDDVAFIEHGDDNRLHVHMLDESIIHTYRDTKTVIFGSKVLTFG